MQITCKRAELLSAVKAAASALPSRSPNDALQCVRLQAGNGRVAVQGTDLEQFLTTWCDAAVTGGAVMVNCKSLLSALRESNAESVAMRVDGETLVVELDDACTYRFGIGDEAEYPRPPSYETDISAELDAESFRVALQLVHFAADTGSARYALEGVYVDTGDEGNLRLVATDGRRMSVVDMNEYPGIERWDDQRILPASAVQTILQTFGDHGEVKFQCGSNGCTLESPDVSLACRLLEGRFPPYSQVIPKDYQYEIVADCAELLQAVKVASVTMNEESRGIRFDFADGRISLSSRSERGQSLARVGAKGVSSDIQPLILDGNYLRQALSAMNQSAPGVAIEMQISGPDKPVVFRYTSYPGWFRGYLHLIMPLDAS